MIAKYWSFINISNIFHLQIKYCELGFIAWYKIVWHALWKIRRKGKKKIEKEHSYRNACSNKTSPDKQFVQSSLMNAWFTSLKMAKRTWSQQLRRNIQYHHQISSASKNCITSGDQLLLMHENLINWFQLQNKISLGVEKHWSYSYAIIIFVSSSYKSVAPHWPERKEITNRKQPIFMSNISNDDSSNRYVNYLLHEQQQNC